MFKAMAADSGAEVREVRVDGGMVVNDWVVQFLADLLDVSVDRPEIVETTALGAAYMAGLKAGVYQSTEQISEMWHLEKRFMPDICQKDAQKLYDGWLDAVARVKSPS